MARSRPPSDLPPVWAIPVSLGTVALWCELPPSSSDVAITFGGAASELRFKRRLIAHGRRLHLFVLRTTDFKASEPCSVTYRPERGRPLIRFQATPSLAEWTTSSVTAAVHAIVGGLAAENGDADTRLLARFLSLTCSWAAPCRYHGSDGGLCLAVFEFVPKAFEPITVLTVANGLVTAQRLRPVPHDEQSCCVVWQGDPFDRAYLELEGELLELKLETRRSAVKPLTNWFAELAAEQQDAVLDGIGPVASDQTATGLEALGRHLSRARDFLTGPQRLGVSAVFGLGSHVFLTVDNAGDGDLSLRLTTLRDRERTYEVWQCASAESDQGRSAVFRTIADLDDMADGSLVRVSVSASDMTASHWMPVQGLENSLARRRITNLIDWESADENFVRDFASASIGTAAIAQDRSPATIALSTRPSTVDDALVICRYSGDLLALRSTLIALRLTVGEQATVRLVCRGRPASADLLDLRALCQSLGLAAGLVMLKDGAPFSAALRVGSDASRHRAIILADSGIVPIDRDWWQRLATIVDHDPTLLCYGVPEGHAAIEPSALTYVSGSCPLIVAGPGFAAAALEPDFELQTFEGILHHAIAMAQRAGSAERLGWLRLLSVASAPTGTSFGAARLDDAMVAAALGAQAPGVSVQKSNLVHLSVRAGAG